MKRGYADTPLGQVHYVTDGEGEPLLLLHEGSRSSRMYWKLIPLLAQEYRAIAIDYLGFGNSDPLPPSVNPDELAQSVAYFMDALGIKKAHIFGLHTGNKVATALSAQFPSRVSSVMLCGQPHSITYDNQRRVRSSFGAVTSVSGGIVTRAGGWIPRAEPSSDESHLVRSWAATHSRLTTIWWHPDVLANKALSSERLQGLAQRALDFIQSRDSMGDLVPSIAAYDWSSGLRKIQAPTLFIELATPEEVEQYGRQGEALVKVVPNSALATMEGAPGDAIESMPEEMSQVILGFLRRL